MQENKKTKTIVEIIVGCLLLISGIVLIYSGASGLFGSDTSNKSLLIGETKTHTEYSSYIGYSFTIYGVAVNNTGKDLSYASIEYSVYDENGNNLGTAIANINNLGKGDKWPFEAVLLSYPKTKPVRYKLVDITYF